MDPWLESPGQWHNVHLSLITLIYTELNQSLPEGFAATMDENVYLDCKMEQRTPFVQIVATTHGEQRVVTVIEVLSPINKHNAREPSHDSLPTGGRGA